MARLPKITKLTRTAADGSVRARSKGEQASLKRKIGRRAGGQESTIAKEFRRRLYQNFFGTRKPLTTMSQFLQGQARAKLGMFGQAVSPNISNEADITLPPMIDPKVEMPKPVANVNTLVMQMDALLKVARQVGALSTEQQNLVIEQIKQAKRIAKEAQMEAKPEPQAEMVQEDDLDIGNALAPLDDAMNQLSKSVRDLIDIINQKINEKCDCSSVGGLPLPGGGNRKNRGVPGVPGSRVSPKSAGGPAKEIILKNPNLSQMRNMPRADRLARANAIKPGLERRIARRAAGQEGTIRADIGRRLRGNFFGNDKQSTMTDYIRAQRRSPGLLTPGRVAAGVGALGAVGAGAMMLGGSKEPVASVEPSRPPVGPAVASTVGAGFKAATPSNEAINEASVAKIAKPVIDKALGSSTFDTIPVSQSAIPATSAANIVKGDVSKAGLDPTSGLVGPMIAMPALSAATARDVYTSIYNMPPENDPTSGPKMAAITNIVDDLIKKSLAPRIEPQPALRMPLGPGGAGGGVTPVTPVSTKPATPSSPVNVSPVKKQPPQSKTTPSGGGGGGGSPPAQPKQTTPAAIRAPATPKVEGAQISSKSMENDMAANYDTSSAAAGVMGSQTGKNNIPNQPKAPARGMDNVPDPVSPDMISIIEMCWFTSRV